MAILLRLGTALYHAGIRLAAPFVPKARAWVEGRRELWERLEGRADALQGCLWIHCASVGEFEQARPVLETIKRARPDLPILLTFFSPSGYAVRKDHPLATHVEYLPADTAANASRLVSLVRPCMAIFIKYEFWYEHLHALERAGVPTYLVSAIFRRSQPFFQWYGGAHRAMLTWFEHLFVQDEGSRDLLASIGISEVTVSGDTRFDRVAAIASKDEVLPRAEVFRASSTQPVLVAGSTWPDDERFLAEALSSQPELRAVIVPHELGEATLNTTAGLFPEPVVRWSGTEDPSGARTLLVDEMGHLSKLYKYADITYVGGGFKSGIHNTLEAAAWGRPVIFGPNYERFAEAHGLIAAGAGFSVRNAKELRQVLDVLLKEPGALHRASEAAGRYVRERIGATQRVTEVLLEKL